MSAPSSASSSPAITLRKVDPTRRMSSVKSGPAVATFTSFSLHVNDLDASLTFFQSLFQWSVIRHEEHDIKDAAGEGVNNGAHSITYVGPSSKDFTLALVYNYGVTLTPETPLHHIVISCNIEKTLSLAKQHGYDIKQEDGDTCIISGDGHRYKLVNVQGEIEKPNVAYVSIFTKSLIRSSDFYTTVLSMSTPTDTPCTTQFPVDIKHSMYGYASNQVQLQLVQYPDVCDKRERLIITCKDVSSMSTRIKSARATLLHQDGVYDMTRDKDGYVIVVANDKEWGKKMEAGENKIDVDERSRRLEMTHVWMKSNPTPAPDPMAHISRTTPPPAVTRITSPGSLERKSSLSNPSSRSSSPMNVVSPTPSPTSVSVLSNSSSTSTASSTHSSILKLPNAKPAHTRLITTDPHPSLQEYEQTIELLQEQLIQKSNELNMAYEKIKNKMEQVKEILQLKEDENQRLRQQLKDAGIAPCVPHQSIGQLIATPVQAVRRLSASRTSTSTPPSSQGRSLTSTPPPSSSQGRNSTSTPPPPPPPSQGRNSTSSPVPLQNQEPVQPRVVSPVA